MPNSAIVEPVTPVWEGPDAEVLTRLKRHPSTGAIDPSTLNAYVILTQDPRWRDCIWHSPTDRCIYVRLPGDEAVRTLGDGSVTAVGLWFQSVYGIRVAHMGPVIRLVAEENAKDIRLDPIMPGKVNLDDFWTVHPWLEPVKQYVEAHPEAFTMEAMTQAVFGCSVTPWQARNLSWFLKMLGRRRHQMMINGVRAYYWFNQPPRYQGKGRPISHLPVPRRVTPKPV